MEDGYREDVIRIIKRQITILNAIIVLMIYIILFFVVRFLYVVLEYIPLGSILTILSISALLMVIGLYLANNASKVAVRKIEDYSRKLNTLLETARDIGETRYIDILLNKVIEGSLKITGAKAGAVALVENGNIFFKILKGMEDERVGKPLPLSRGITGWVVKNGSPVRVDNPAQDSRFDPEVDIILGSRDTSLLCVPMKVDHRVIGVIQHTGDTFTQEDEDILQHFANQAAISIDRTRFMEDRRVYEIHITNMLVEIMDNFLFEKKGHARRVAKYSLLIADEIGLAEGRKKKLYQAALLHDIGFLRMPSTGITDRRQYQSHSELGYQMLSPINFYKEVSNIILHHHERYDGLGYPSGLIGEQIPLESRILAIAEAFDAMISRFSYKNVSKVISEDIRPSICGFREAIEEIRKNAGTQFDPHLAEVFIRRIDEDELEE